MINCLLASIVFIQNLFDGFGFPFPNLERSSDNVFAEGYTYVLVRVDLDGRRRIVLTLRFVINIEDSLTLITWKLTSVVGMDTASGRRHVGVGHSETVKQYEELRV
jgi:hypothetical protein